MSTDKDSSRKEFVSEAEEILEEITADLQNLEASLKKDQVRPELINKLFREFHSLKGISGMLGFQSISDFTHELENMLDHLRLGKIVLNPHTIDLLYQALDMLTRMLGDVSQQERNPADPSPVIKKVHEAMRLSNESSAAKFDEITLDEQTLRSLTEYEEYRLRENIRTKKYLFSIKLALSHTTFDQDLRQIAETLGHSGELISTLPFFDVQASANAMLFRLLYGTNDSKDKLQSSLGRYDVEIITLTKTPVPDVLAPSAVEEDTGGESTPDGSLKSFSSTVRVDILKLDEVINIIGDLVITKAAITNLSRQLMRSGSGAQAGVSLSRLSHELDKKLSDLQHSVIETRLVPIGQIYHKLGRLVRKVSRETGKQIDLKFFGEDTKLDKIMIEQISDPLMHIIRNAIDHGLETKEERKKNGKSESGLIQIGAFQRGNHVVIQVEDDGRGIQLQKIQEHAKKQGLIPKERMLEQRECLELIFSPGFSSSDRVTELSGRGVGLDVVKRNIAELKGVIHVFSEEGRGTIFEITLPITLAIIRALIVKIQDVKYAIPLSSVIETVRIFSKDVQTVDRKEVYYLREKTIPMIRVSQMFGLPPDPPAEKLFLVLVEMNDQIFGLVVDSLAGQQEIIIKSMGEKLKNIPGIAGAAEIGEKKPILVIDPESMIDEVTHGKVRIT